MSNTENNFKSYLLSKCTIGYGIINGLINARNILSYGEISSRRYVW